MDFTGRRVVITGAGGGLGRTLTARFAAAGAVVVGCDLPGADLIPTLADQNPCVHSLIPMEVIRDF